MNEEPHKATPIQYVIAIGTILILFAAIILIPASKSSPSNTFEVLELQNTLNQKQGQIDSLNKKIGSYQERVEMLRAQKDITPLNQLKLSNEPPKYDLILARYDASKISNETLQDPFEYSIVAINPKTYEQQLLGKITSQSPNYYRTNPFATLAGNQIIYRDFDENLIAFNIDTRQKTILVSSNQKSYGVRDFLIKENKITYLFGACGEGEECDLNIYDLAQSQNFSILKNFQEQLTDEVAFLSVQDLVDFEPRINAVMISNNWGDAGSSGSGLYAVNTDTKTMTKINSYHYSLTRGGLEGYTNYEDWIKDYTNTSKSIYIEPTQHHAYCHDTSTTQLKRYRDYWVNFSSSIQNDYLEAALIGCLNEKK